MSKPQCPAHTGTHNVQPTHNVRPWPLPYTCRPANLMANLFPPPCPYPDPPPPSTKPRPYPPRSGLTGRYVQSANVSPAPPPAPKPPLGLAWLAAVCGLPMCPPPPPLNPAPPAPPKPWTSPHPPGLAWLAAVCSPPTCRPSPHLGWLPPANSTTRSRWRGTTSGHRVRGGRGQGQGLASRIWVRV